jgi:hypothetical protein
MRNLEKLRVICRETQSGARNLSAFHLGQTKPIHDGDALKRDTNASTRIRT